MGVIIKVIIAASNEISIGVDFVVVSKNISCVIGIICQLIVDPARIAPNLNKIAGLEIFLSELLI